MLRAFVDASRAHRAGGPPVLAIAGFAGTVSGWSSFQKKWREARTQSGLDYFHMTDFMSRKAKPYKDWTEKKRNAVIGRLIELINRHLLFGVSAAVNVSDLSAYAQGGQDRLRSGHNPYSFCANQAIGLVIHALEVNKIDEQVMWIFEGGDRGQPEFIASMNRICSASERLRESFRIFSVMPGSKKQFPGLDAADFLAWETPQHVQRMDGDAPGEISTYVKRIQLQMFTNYLHGENMNLWAVDVKPEDIREFEDTFGVRVRRNKKRPAV